MSCAFKLGTKGKNPSNLLNLFWSQHTFFLSQHNLFLFHEFAHRRGMEASAGSDKMGMAKIAEN